jgi:myo-inositol-1(or 4)-monophosphatase
MKPIFEKSSPEQIKNLNSLLKTGRAAVNIGEDCLMRHFGRIKKVELKEKSNYVSQADRETEVLMSKFLKKQNPDIDFLGEESHFFKSKKFNFLASEGYRWILDPLDGTTNFIHGFPLFCISLGLEFRGEIVVGIIHVPLLKQTFTAIKNQGAFLNGQRIHVSKKTKLSDAFVATGFVNQSKAVLTKQLKIFNKTVWKMDAIRRGGSAAYDLALVSQGVFDFYWEENIKPWDIAAGFLLVKEAGGKICDYRGKPVNVFTKQIVAGNPRLVSQFNKYTKSFA